MGESMTDSWMKPKWPPGESLGPIEWEPPTQPVDSGVGLGYQALFANEEALRAQGESDRQLWPRRTNRRKY